MSKELVSDPDGFKQNYFDDSVVEDFDNKYRPGFTIQQIGNYLKDFGAKISGTIQQSYNKQQQDSSEVKAAE